FGGGCRPKGTAAGLAKTVAEGSGLVVFGGSLFREESPFDDGPRDYERARCESRAKQRVEPRTAHARCADDSLGLELHVGRFTTMVAAAIADHQRADGLVRCRTARHFVSRFPAMVDPNRHACVWNWRNDRDDETAQSSFKPAQRAFVPARACD